MVFPLYVTLERMDRTLIEASKDLGAGRWATFRQVTLPIALPGLVTGSILVFIPMMGEYVIPQLLGLGRTYLMGNALVTDFLDARNWPNGSARAVFLILIMLVTITALPVVREPGPQDARGQRAVSAPAVPAAVPRLARPIRARPDRPLGVASSSSGSGPTRRSSTCSSTCRSSSSSCSRSTTPRASPRGGRGSACAGSTIALNDPVVLKSLANSFIVAIPNAILATAFGTMAALGLQRVGQAAAPRVRRA